MRSRWRAADSFRRQIAANNNVQVQNTNYLKYRSANQDRQNLFCIQSKFRVTAEGIALSLNKGRSVGDKKYSACCPAHNDKNPSLSVTEAMDGKILVHCFSGCSQEAVIRALHDLGLWGSDDSSKTRLPIQADYELFEIILDIAIADLESGNSETWTNEDKDTILGALSMIRRF